MSRRNAITDVPGIRVGHAAAPEALTGCTGSLGWGGAPVGPAAIRFDVGVGRADVRPDAAMGYAACMRASTDPPAEGNAGAGMGATVGELFGMGGAMRAGIGAG